MDTAVKPRVRVDYVPAEHYLSREIVQLEKRLLWPRVWQLACRLEEIPFVGDYVTYDINDESIIVVRRRAGHASAPITTSASTAAAA